MSKRLFIGLELPASCRETLALLDPGIKGVRWLTSGQMHLTMSFLGNVETDQEKRLHEALEPVQVPAFFLPIKGVGTFGGARPTVVWAGVGNGHPHLFALHKRIQDALLQAGLQADLRPFHPHITIGRVKNAPRSALQPFARRHAETEFGLWQVRSFTLFSSVLSSDSATHAIELRHEFAPPRNA